MPSLLLYINIEVVKGDDKYDRCSQSGFQWYGQFGF